MSHYFPSVAVYVFLFQWDDVRVCYRKTQCLKGSDQLVYCALYELFSLPATTIQPAIFPVEVGGWSSPPGKDCLVCLGLRTASRLSNVRRNKPGSFRASKWLDSGGWTCEILGCLHTGRSGVAYIPQTFYRTESKINFSHK